MSAACPMDNPMGPGGGGNPNPPDPITITDLAVTQTGEIREGRSIMLMAEATVTGANEASYAWSLVAPAGGLEGLNIATPNAATTTVELPYLNALGDTASLQFRVTASAGEGASARTETATSDTLTLTAMADGDGDGLIEIRSLTMLHNMRHSLNGEQYATSATALGLRSGCPDLGGCNGYELIADLNFDASGDNSTWTDNGDGTFTIDSADNNADYFAVAADGTGGWLPIGSDADGQRFSGIFDGNGYTIHNLAINRSGINGVGLFGASEGPGHIRNTHLLNVLVAVSGTATVHGNDTGALVGTALSPLVASSVIGTVRSVGFGVGGLVGDSRSIIVASYSEVSVTGVVETGGLVGSHIGQNIFITASYARGSVDPLVPNIANQFGSLVGNIQGSQTTRLTASYAAGNATARSNAGNIAGSFSRFSLSDPEPTITESYGFGTASDSNDPDTDDSDNAPNTLGTALPMVSDGAGGMRSITASELTLSNAGTSWNSAASNTAGAWDFSRRVSSAPAGTSGGPSLRYADYDGASSGSSGNLFYCAGEPAPTVGASDPVPIRIARCGEHLPHQFASE